MNCFLQQLFLFIYLKQACIALFSRKGNVQPLSTVMSDCEVSLIMCCGRQKMRTYQLNMIFILVILLVILSVPPNFLKYPEFVCFGSLKKQKQNLPICYRIWILNFKWREIERKVRVMIEKKIIEDRMPKENRKSNQSPKRKSFILNTSSCKQ